MKLMMCTTNPAIAIASRPNLFVFDPNNPNKIPPNTSPIPMHIPDSPTNCLDDSPNDSVNPMLGLYTPLKKDNSSPETALRVKE